MARGFSVAELANRKDNGAPARKTCTQCYTHPSVSNARSLAPGLATFPFSDVWAPLLSFNLAFACARSRFHSIMSVSLARAAFRHPVRSPLPGHGQPHPSRLPMAPHIQHAFYAISRESCHAHIFGSLKICRSVHALANRCSPPAPAGHSFRAPQCHPMIRRRHPLHQIAPFSSQATESKQESRHTERASTMAAAEPPSFAFAFE